MKERIKKRIKKIKKGIVNYGNKFYLWLPFILMDFFTFILGIKIRYYRFLIISPMLFSFAWIFLFVNISLSLKKFFGKVLYIITNLLFMFLFLLNNIYYSMTKNFFDFNLLSSASEGKSYILDAIKNANILVYLFFAIIIVTFVIALKKYPVVKNNNFKKLGITLLVFVILHLLTPLTYGPANTKLKWSSWRNPRNIYISFNDNNKSMKIAGLYEYSFRNFYVTYMRKTPKEKDFEKEFLESSYEELKSELNKYTGIFQDKNLILIQLEGTDSWLINENDTPTMFKMMKEGINFKNHFSYYNGGGSTFNSELAVNTGFITPLSYTKNAYSFNKNAFPYSLANMFKEEDYSINAFHMNTGEYYSRRINYKNWGYENYYSLQEIDDYKDESYKLDTELILNEKFNELMFPEDTKFVDYLIAYSGHFPFTNKKEVCKMLYDKDREENNDDSEFVLMSEEECIRRQARETDDMVKLLIDKLQEKELLDNTVIMIFTDHYLYTIEDVTILERYKTTENNLINNTPWFIWSSDIKSKEVKSVTSQLNILPTLLNLFGFSYNPNNYIGKDALSSNYNGLVFFSDYSWYDGNVYVESGEVTNGKSIKVEELAKKNNLVNDLARKNDLTLKYDHFKRIKNKS